MALLDRSQQQPWCPLLWHPARRLMMVPLNSQWQQQQQMCQLSKPLRYLPVLLLLLLLLLLLSMMIIVI
jgi:hypothetical protein